MINEKMNQRVMLTKQLLKNGLIEMLKKEAIYKISIRDLCENAGINRSTFYKYYGSQFDLLAEMEQDLLNDISAFLSEEKDRSHKPLEHVLRYLENNIEFVRLLFNSNVDPEFPRKLFSLPAIQQMLQGFSEKKVPDREKEYAMSFLLYGGFQMVQLWVNKDQDRESPEWMALLIENLIQKSNG